VVLDLSGILCPAMVSARPDRAMGAIDLAHRPSVRFLCRVLAKQRRCGRHQVVQVAFDLQPAFHVVFRQPPDCALRQVQERTQVADNERQPRLCRADALAVGKPNRAGQRQAGDLLFGRLPQKIR
jgi:hypothetical protein